MEFVDRRGRVVAVQEGDGGEWREFFEKHLETIEALARPRQRRATNYETGPSWLGIRGLSRAFLEEERERPALPS